MRVILEVFEFLVENMVPSAGLIKIVQSHD